MRPIRKLVLVTTALGLADGGAASLARLVARATHTYCQANSLEFEILDLGSPADILSGIPITHFSSNQNAIALAIWHRTLQPPQTAFIFMHIGLARTIGILPRFLLPPYMLWFLGVEAWRPFSYERRRAVINAASRVAISAFTERRTREFHPWLPPTQVLHLALEERSVTGDLDEALLDKAGDKFILIVGRLDASQRHKGHDDLIKALPRVVQSAPDAKLVIAGKGDDLPRLQALAKASGTGSQVIFTGFVSEKTRDELYRRCRVFAMLSRDDGFGLVYLEAMKASKPCIALQNASGAEIIRDGETGFLVEHDNQAQLENVLVRCLNDNHLYQALGQSGYRHWLETFSFQAFETRLHSHLHKFTSK